MVVNLNGFCSLVTKLMGMGFLKIGIFLLSKLQSEMSDMTFK